MSHSEKASSNYNDCNKNAIVDSDSSTYSYCSSDLEQQSSDISENDEQSHDNQNLTRCHLLLYEKARVFLSKNLIPDQSLVRLGSVQIFHSIEAVRIVKFFILTISMLHMMYFVSRYLNWEHDYWFTISSFWKDDSSHVTLDSVTFAIIARLYTRNGVDRLFPIILPMTFSCLLTSWLTTDIWFLKNSITWHNFRYTWPWQLHLFAFTCVSVLVCIIGLHVKASCKDNTFTYRSIEALLLFLLFIAPHIAEPKFHLHHWYSFWLFGALCNRDEWWSQFAMALSWGVYINGISVYGRDGLYERT